MKTIEQCANELSEECERGWTGSPFKTLPFAMREVYALGFYTNRAVVLAYEIELLRDTTYRVKIDPDCD